MIWDSRLRRAARRAPVERTLLTLTDDLLREAASDARRARSLAGEARRARPGTAYAVGTSSSDKVEEGADRVAEGAAKLAQAAFALDLRLKLARSTNTFRWWQQAPAWALAAGGLALAFLLSVFRTEATAPWIAVVLILALSVIAMFRGPADLSLGTGEAAGAPQPSQDESSQDEPSQDEGQDVGPDGSDGQGRPSSSSRPESSPRPQPPGTLQPTTSPHVEEAPEAAGSSHPGDPAEGSRATTIRPLASGRGTTTQADGPRGADGRFRVMGLGLRLDGSPLVPTLPEVEFATRIRDGLERNVEALRLASDRSRRAFSIRPQQPSPNLTDPKAAGWTYLVRQDDAQRDDLIEIVTPLAIARGMEDPGDPLVYGGETDWQRWLEDGYTSLGRRRPRYVLIVGGPDQIPFQLQPILDVAAMVGRVAFDDLDDLRAYVDKIVRLEETREPTEPEAVFFAPDYGGQDPTRFSRRYLAEPLEQIARTRTNVRTTMIQGQEATKARLVDALTGIRPALVFTASHGMAALDQDLATQKRYNGAICCQQEGGSAQDWLFSADDVPGDEQPFLEGAVFFQFACFGYGTPAQSDFAHWDLGYPEANAAEDFVAALPKRMLAHPRGPVAFIAHLDTAWLHGFDDPDDPEGPEFLPGRWSPRLSPFEAALDALLHLAQPPGFAMEDMNVRYNTLNGVLARYYDQLRRGILEDNSAFRIRLATEFITRSDAQNYMIFGDPAVTLRIGA